MSVSNSSARTFDGLVNRACHTNAVTDVGEGRAERSITSIDVVRRTGVKVVTRGSKKYAKVMAQHRAILLARKESEK